MRPTIVLVTALFAASAATPWGSRANQQCASYCKETSKFKYSVGTVYSYDYIGESATKISGTSEQESRLHILAQADLEVLSQCELALKLKKVSLEQSNPEDASVRSAVAGSPQFAAELEKHPLVFSFQDGQIEHMCPSVDEPIWALNIKRGILSAIQNSMSDLSVSQLVFETDVVGHCESNYTVENHGRNSATISRSKDLLACTGRNSQYSPVLSTPYSSTSSIQSLPLLRSENECQQTIRNQLLEKSVCTETHLFRPFSNEQSGATTRVTQTLTYNHERRSDQASLDFKRKRATLLFVDPNADEKSFSASLGLIENTLKVLVQDSLSGISPRTPQLFSQLVTALRPLSYIQISELFSRTQETKAKKYLMDAAPLVGTAASYGLMRDIIQEGLLSDLEVDMWLASLAFQTKPTLSMINAVSPMLDNPVRPKALLSISALIHAYCRNNPSNCETEKVVHQLVSLIENRLGLACRSITEEEQSTILLALKALGNAGRIISSVETLKRCYQEETNSMVIRLAAIDALRRVPCHMGNRDSLLSFYQETKHDSELRIAAYLAIMQCPSAQILDEVKQTLIHENVNQVGSFVWTHLTNLQETSSQSKQAVRQLLASEFLRNKFSTDVRKFSRNLELSSYWPDLNAGGSVESNIIFSSQSYLPRSASLNLTLDLFGESVNLFELGARLEGFESLVESFFGPNGIYPDDTIQKALESLRGKRAAPMDQHSLNQLSTIYDVKSQLADEPQGDIYLRIFGNELHNHRFKGLNNLMGKSNESPLAMILKAAGQKDIDFSKSSSILDVSYVLPTIIGLPLSLSVNASATVGLKMGGTFHTASLTDVKVVGHVKPSGTVVVNSLMSVDALTFVSSGVHVQNTMHTSTGLSGKVIIQGNRLVSVQLDAPEEATNTFSFDSRLFLLQKDGPKAIQPENRSRTDKKICSPTWLSRTFGAELCSEFDFYPRTKDGPRGLLTGPVHAALYLRKTDKHSNYRFDYKREGSRALSITMDTPDSNVNRRLSAQVTLDDFANSLQASFVCPQKSVGLVGKYDYNQLLKAIDVMLNIDGAEMASIRAALRTDLRGPSGRYEPSLIISQRGKELINFQGYLSFVGTSKYGFDFQLKHLTVRPIRLTGDVSKDNDNKHELNFGLKSYMLDATLSSTLRLSDKLSTTKMKIGYSFMEGTSQSLELSGKHSRMVKGSLRKTTLAGILQSSQFPQYNGDLSWDLQQSENYLENNIRLNTGAELWEIHQLYSGLQRDVNIRLGIVCNQQKIDWLIFTTLQSTDSTFNTQSGLRLSPGRQWTGRLDLLQDHQSGLRYSGSVELASPTVSRKLQAEVNQELENRWNMVIEYSTNNDIETSVLAVYKNLSDGIKCEHAFEIKLRSWATEELDLDSLFISSPVHSFFGVNGRYGDNKMSASTEYENRKETVHVATARVIRNEDPLFVVNMNADLSKKKTLMVDIQSGRRITIDAHMTSSLANVQLFWDRDVDLSRSFEFSGQLSATGGEAQLRCTRQHPVRISVDKIGKDLKAQIEWQSNQAVTLRMELLPTRTTGMLFTPFDGFRQISFDSLHKCSRSAIDTKLTVEWQGDRFTIITTGGVTPHNVHGTFSFSSTFAQLENVAAEFQVLRSQPKHLYSVAISHNGREAKISADYNRKEFVFSGASIVLATPFAGYEFLKAGVGYHQHVGGFKSDVKLQGPFSSEMEVIVSGKSAQSETGGNLTVTTNFSVLETFATSFQLYNAPSEKKLTITGDLNDHNMVTRATASLSSKKIRSDLLVSSSFADDVSAILNHNFDGQVLQSQAEFNWANKKSIQLSTTGQIVPGKSILNVTLITPSWLAGAKLDHKRVAGKLDTLLEAEFNGKRATCYLNAQQLYADNLNLQSKLKTPFAGWEELRMNLEHRRDGRKTNTRMQLGRLQKEIVLEHDMEYTNLFNWVNRLNVKTPFEGMSSLSINSKQSWTNRFEHDGQLMFNNKNIAVILKADNSQSNIFTATGSLITSWSEDVFFELKHSDDGQQFHPVLIIRTGSSQPIRVEAVYRRGPKNPNIIIEIVSPLSDPLKLSAGYHNTVSTHTVKMNLNWNGNRNIDCTVDWTLAAFQSTIRTRLSTPFMDYRNIEGDVIYDLLDQRKTATILLRREDQTILLDAFAASQGPSYHSEVVLSSPFYETVRASAIVDLANARASLKLDRGNSQIQLQGMLIVAATQTAVKATLETPFDALRVLKVEASLTPNGEIQLDIDFDGQKISIIGAHSTGPAKGSIRANLKTPFVLLRSGSIDAIYDASGSTKTASLTLSKNNKLIQASAQIVITGPIKLAVNVRAPCCGIQHLDVTGSFEESSERKSGHLKLDLNGEKYQLDGHLLRSNGTAELALKSLTGYQGYEQVIINAKYDIRRTAKTGSLTFSKNDDRFHFVGTANPRSIVADLTTPIDFLKMARVEGRWESETALLTVIRNEETIRLTAGGSLKSWQGKLDCSLETPYSGYENLKAELVYDLQSTRKFIVLDAGAVRAELEWDGRRLVIRSNTPIVGYEQLALTGDYALDDRDLLAAFFFEKNGEKIEVRFSGRFDPVNKEASFEFQSPEPIVRVVSSQLKWNFDHPEKKSVNFQAVRNEMTVELEMNGRFVPDNSALALVARSNIEGWNSASLSAAYDIRSSVVASLTVEKNGVEKSFSSEAKLDRDSALLAIQTPFEGFRSLGLSGKFIDTSKVNVSSDRTVLLHLEKENVAQDYGLSLSFDAHSAALSVETPFEGYQQMSSKVRFELDNLVKTVNLIVTKNKDQLEFSGAVNSGEVELKLTSTLPHLRNAVLVARYDFLSAAKSFDVKMSLNDKIAQLNVFIDGLKIDINVATPFTGVEKFHLNGEIQLKARTGRATFHHNNQHYEASGSLTDRRMIAQVKTPFNGYEVTDISGRWNDHQVEFGLTNPSLGKIVLTMEYDLGKSIQFGRIVVMHNNFRYRNELVANVADPWVGGQVLLGVQLPLEGLRNSSATLVYDLASAEKTLTLSADNSAQHYETNARVSLSNETGRIVVHVQTPVPSWEEIDLSTGYDLSKNTVFFITERNGKPIVSTQGLAILSATSSVVSASLRFPSLLAEDLEMAVAYNLASESADAKIKFYAHEILFDGKRSKDWTSALATISTSFDQIQNAQVSWNWNKKIASLHFNKMKVTLDGRIQGPTNVGVKSVLSGTSLGTHTFEIEWNLLSNKFAGKTEYKSNSSQRFGVNSLVNFSVEKGDYRLVVHTGRTDVGDVQLIGSWTCDEKIKSESALHWAGMKKVEAIFDGQFSLYRSVAQLHLVAPKIRPVKTEIQYDISQVEKYLRFDFNSAMQVDVVTNIKSVLHWDGKLNLNLNSRKYSTIVKCYLQPSSLTKELLVRLENDDVASTIRMTMERRDQNSIINASIVSPIFENELKFNGHFDTSLGLNTAGTFSWTEHKNIKASFQMNPSELSAELKTPFTGLEITRLIVKYNLGQQKQSVDSSFLWSGRTVTASASWEFQSGLVFSVRLTTPFQGFEEVGLRGNFLSGAEYSTTLSYSRAGKIVDIQGKLTSNSAGTTARVSFTGENELLSAVVEYDVRLPKKTASLIVTRGTNQRVSVTMAGEFSEKINGILFIETSASFPIRLSVDLDPVAAEKNGRLTFEWGQQQKFELLGGWSTGKTGSKVRLAAQTPFEGFKKILLNGRLNPKAFDLSIEYGRSRKAQLNGQYRWDSKLSVYSVNGTLSTPWLENAVSAQSFLDMSNGFHGSFSTSLAPQKTYGIVGTYTHSGSMELSVQSPYDILRNAKLSGAFEKDDRKMSRTMAAGVQYNDRQASIEGRLTSQNGLNLSVRGSLNHQVVSLDSFFQNTTPSYLKMTANVTTPFEGYKTWAVRLERAKKGPQSDLAIHLTTPLLALPTVDVSLQTLLESGKRLDVGLSVSAVDHTGRAKLQVAKNIKTYSANLELDVPFVETLRSVNLRAECQIDGWKSVVSTVSAGVPAGEYTVKGSVLISKSSVNLNAGIKTPSFSKSIEMGAGYNAANSDLIQGELFVWDNKLEGRYEKRGSQIVVELGLSLPDLKLAHSRLNVEMNYRSPQQIQSTLTFMTLQKSHTVSLAYQLAGNKFTGQLDVDTPLFQNKKVLSLKVNYGSLASMTFDGRFANGPSVCELTGSLRLTDDLLHSQIKVTCPMFGALAIELMGSLTEGKLSVTTGRTAHRLSYKLNVNNGGYDVTVDAQSPSFQPVHLRGVYMLSDVNQGQASLIIRYGESSHSLLGDYLRSGGDKTVASFSIASTFLPGGQASMKIQYQPFDLNVNLDVLGQTHRLTGFLQRWPNLSGRVQLDSPLLPWKTMALNALAERSLRDLLHGVANVTASYGDQSLGLAGRFRYAQWSDFEGSMELNTPFRGWTTARVDVHFSAITIQRVNASINFQSSHIALPRATLGVQYHLSRTSLEAFATFPINRWKPTELTLNIPLALENAKALASFSTPDTKYSISGLQTIGRRQFQTEIELDYAGQKFATQIIFKADEIYQAKIDVKTPFVGFKSYSWDIKGQANVRRWGEATAFLDWNGKRIEFSSNVKVEPLAYIAVVQLNTPFVDFERYAVHLRLEGTDRKTLHVEVESPGFRVGSDFDYVFNSPTDFVGKASIRTPIAGYESFTLHLSNQLGASSYSGNAEARFADYGLAANVVGLIREGGFQAQVDGRYNDRVVVLKSSGSLDEKRVICNLNLVTPYEEVRSLEGFVQLEKDLAENKGLGLTLNGQQLVLVSLAKQTDGLNVLQIQNPWRPIDFSYSWESDAHLVHYHAQLCWDLNRRSSASLGGQVVVKTSSYGRQVTIKTVTPIRETTLEYALELTTSKLDHSIHLSWASGKTAGYRVLAENASTRRKIQLSGSVRLDLPARSFQVESQHAGGETTATSVDFKWDAARNPEKRLGVRMETKLGRQVRLVLLHPAMERDVVLQGEFDRVDGKLTGQLEVIYSPLEDHRVVIEGSTIGQESGRAVRLAVLHPASNTDLRLVANIKRNAGTQVHARLDYLDRSKASRFLQLGGRLIPDQRLIEIEARTTEKSLSMTNSMKTSGTAYVATSRTLVNDADALILDARLETSSLNPTLKLHGSYDGGKSFDILAGMPDRREVTFRAVRDIHGRKITDGHFQIKLNQTDLLYSRFHWRAASRTELRNAAVNGLIDILTACESFADDFANFFSSEWIDKRAALTPAMESIARRLSDSTSQELNAIRSEFNKMKVELAAMYQRNDFYIRNIVSTLKQVASLAQPFFDRTMANIETISRAVINESTAFYRAAANTYSSLARTTYSGYVILSGYVSSGVTQAARSYSQLAGEVMSRLIRCEAALVNAFQQAQAFFNEYAGRLETVVMEQVEAIRQQIIDMAASYAEIFLPYTQYFAEWTERIRVFYFDIVADISDIQKMIQERLLTFPPFQRMYALYLEYASWLEEFHIRDYIDECIEYVNNVKEEFVQKVKSMTARYQPLIDPLIQAFQGQLDDLKQLPIVIYLNTAMERFGQQINEFSKYVELEAKFREILRDVLHHTDRLTTQLMKDLKGSLTFPMEPTVVVDWESGRLEYSQRLPFTWENFGQLPRIREFPLLRKIAKAKTNLIREMDYSQLYFTAMNVLATYRPMRLQSIFPPFGSRAFVAGTQHYMTFDRRFYEFAGECSYLLASDFFSNDFSAVVNYEGAGGKVIRKSLTVLSDGRQVEIDSSFRVTINGRKIEMPLSYQSTTIERDGQRIIVTNKKSGFHVDCNLYRDICSVHVSGWSFGKTGGLFGVYNNEPSDDFLTPFRQQRSEYEVDSFANSWKVGSARCRVRNFAVTRPAPNARNSRLCEQLFSDEQSVLRPCFQMIDPAPFAKMCLNDLAALENSPKKELGICTSASAYASECRFAGLDLFVPPQCVRCELEDGRVMGSGEIKTFQNDAPRSADVVFIVDQKPCLNGTRLSYLPAAIDAALKERGIQQNRFAVVGYGGRGGSLFEKPHIRTTDGGQVWSHRKGIQLALEDLPLADEQASAPSDIHAALRYAVNLPFRVGVSKQFVLVSCGDNECQSSSYADTLTLLIENDVKLHLLQPRDIVVKGRNSTEELKNVFGFDAEEVYTVRNVRSLNGDRELRRQLAMPKDFCTPLALETNGTLFDLKKMMPGQQQQQTKKFIDIFARRIAVTGEPSPCQRCDCIGDRDGVGSILCQRCVSPVMERLDKMWEKLVYENEMENASNIEAVTIPQRESILDQLDKVGRLALPTTPLQK